MRIYEYMKGILGAMGVGEDVGVPEPSWRIEEYLKAIYDKLKEGGSLPPVTSADNGKVLAVKDGAWAADSNLFLVGRTGSSLDYTYAEIKAAIDAGREVELTINNNRYRYAGIYMNTIYFTMEQPSDTSNYVYIYGVKSNNTYVSKQLPYLPAVSNADVGSELVPKNGAWVKQQKKFIVTLTPTEQDFSGTMDKTAEEITAAYEAGQEIVFNVVGFPGFDHVYIPAAWCAYATGAARCAACATFVDVSNGLQIIIVTSDAVGSTNYYTDIYSLTHAS